MKNNQRGFTLIELLIVIGIIGILAGITLVFINPAEQFGKANDAERKSEIKSILSAVFQYQTSPVSRGDFPRCTVNSAPNVIPECDTDSSGIGTGNGGFEGALELGTAITSYNCTSTLAPNYIKEIPVDPDETAYDAAGTGYWICQDTNGLSPKLYVISEGAEVFTNDGGCEIPGTTNEAMCVSG